VAKFYLRKISTVRCFAVEININYKKEKKNDGQKQYEGGGTQKCSIPESNAGV
jgi:hypothetical protein